MGLSLFMGSVLVLCAQEDREIERWMSMDLEELSQVRLVSVSVGKKNLSMMESPGIVSLITENDIENSGARDLIDLLRMVPGFDFGVDVESSIGLGVRGNWAYEGKVMVLLDGQELNDLLYATFPFGARIPLDQIARIEIIRGPGSSIYGGFAELAVVNIVSKIDPGSLKTELSARYGQMSESFARRSLTLTTGGGVGALSIGLGVSAGQGRRSQLTFRDFYGGSYDMKDGSGLSSLMVNLVLKYKGFNTRYILDYYGFRQQDAFESVLSLPIRYDFISHHFDTRHEFPLGRNIKLVPRLQYSVQYPWNSTDDNSVALDFFYKVRADRLKLSLDVVGDISERVFINGSVSRYLDRGGMLGDTKALYLFKGEREVEYSGTTVYLQSFIRTAPVIVSAGIRYEHHNLYPDSLVPWVGLNKIIDRFYFKLLFGQSLRIPSMANISLGNDIRSEKATEMSFEAGCQITPGMTLSLNAFTTGIQDIIAYSADQLSDEEYYENAGRTGSWGFEIEYLLKGKRGNFSGSYSFYRARNNHLDIYAVPADPSMLLGFPAHKLCLSAGWHLAPGLNVNSSLIYYSKRYGCSGVDDNDNPVIAAFPAEFLAGVTLNFREILRNLDLSLGIHDLFDSRYRYLQPYTGLHAPYPGTSREIVFQLRYRVR